MIGKSKLPPDTAVLNVYENPVFSFLSRTSNRAYNENHSTKGTIMNPALKQAIIEGVSLCLVTFGVTGVGFLTVKLCTKVYGPIEVQIKD